ncbi:deoxycytidyl transferase [Lobulomyces angularis]|nr:deoxycytidyl transferase [Lobulomyces angularis]
MAYKNDEDYMAHKQVKLDEQYEFVGSQGTSKLFEGLVFYFDGYRSPDPNFYFSDFKELVLKNDFKGAMLDGFLTKRTTHIIAQSMTRKKMDEWKKPIVKPEWIFECLQNKRLVRWQNFKLFEKEIVGGQVKLSFTKPSNGSSSALNSLTDLENEKNMIPTNVTDHTTSTSKSTYYGANPKKVDVNSAWAKQNISSAPNFIENFYLNSRLSHLSNWKSDLKEFVRENQQSNVMVDKLNKPKTFMHIDMDCFFASVSLRDKPQLWDKPVAIAHSEGTTGGSSTSDVASCNYVARSFGIKNGVSLGKARQLCPNLQVLHYDFEKYDEVSKKLYLILLKHTNFVQAVSCDEAFIEVTHLMPHGTDDEHLETAVSLAESIRRNIFNETQCKASIGISRNILLSRIATKSAKPDGVIFISKSNTADFLNDLDVGELPGVGYHIKSKLNASGVFKCQDLQTRSLFQLEHDFGQKTGEMLYKYCRGIDDRGIENKERKSIGVDIAWGVRIASKQEYDEFLAGLTRELSERMTRLNLKGRLITLKLKSKLYEGEPSKVLGSGRCENFSKSVSLSRPMNDFGSIFVQVSKLATELAIGFEKIRGVGISVTKLDATSTDKGSVIRTLLEKQAEKQKKRIREDAFDVEPIPAPKRFEINPSQVDPDVLELLPPDIQEEFRNSLQKKMDNGRIKQSDESIIGPSSSQSKSFLSAIPVSIRREIDSELCYSRRKGKNKISSTVNVSPSKELLEEHLVPKSHADLNLEVYNALPDFIREEYEEIIFKTPTKERAVDMLSNSRKKVLSPVTPTNIVNEENIFPTLSQMDKSIYENLPLEIQKEIKTHLRILEHRKKFSPAKNFNLEPPLSNKIYQERLKEAMYPTISQVDNSFLEALPEELKREVNLTLKMNKKKKNIENSNINNTTFVDAVNSCNRSENFFFEKPKFFNECEFHIIFEMLSIWILTPTHGTETGFFTPMESDKLAVKNFFLELVEGMYLDDVLDYLKMMKIRLNLLKTVSIDCYTNWEECFLCIVKDVNDQVFKLYNSKLVL